MNSVSTCFPLDFFISPAYIFFFLLSLLSYSLLSGPRMQQRLDYVTSSAKLLPLVLSQLKSRRDLADTIGPLLSVFEAVHSANIACDLPHSFNIIRTLPCTPHAFQTFVRDFEKAGLGKGRRNVLKSFVVPLLDEKTLLE